jgi:hypothetical protein
MKKVDFKSRKLFPVSFRALFYLSAPKSWHYFSDLKNDNLQQCITMIEFFFLYLAFFCSLKSLGKKKTKIKINVHILLVLLCLAFFRAAAFSFQLKWSLVLRCLSDY